MLNELLTYNTQSSLYEYSPTLGMITLTNLYTFIGYVCVRVLNCSVASDSL